MLLAHLRDAGEHADRTGDRSQRIADFMSDGGGQPAHGCQAILHADFPLQSPDLGEIIEGIDVAQRSALRHGEGSHSHPNRFAEASRRVEANFGVGLLRFAVGQRIEK